MVMRGRHKRNVIELRQPRGFCLPLAFQRCMAVELGVLFIC